MEPGYEVIEDTLIVYVPRELDHHSAKAVREYADSMIKKEPIRNIVFDFSDTVFMDSSGVGMIMGRYRLIKDREGFAGMRGAGPAIRRILEISGLYKILQVCG